MVGHAGDLASTLARLDVQYREYKPEHQIWKFYSIRKGLKMQNLW